MAATTIGLDRLLEVEPQRGTVIVRGTGTSVQRIVGVHLEGRSATEIVEAFPHLTLGSVYAALSYYYQNKAALDAEHQAEVAASVAAAKELGAEIR